MLTALYQQVQEANAVDHHHDAGPKRQYRFHSAPPDGLCCYHSVLGSLKIDEWYQIARHSSGFAVNSRRVKEEGREAEALRKLALASTDRTDPTMVQLAENASKHLSLDVSELSWLGNTLDLAIRCTISEQVS